MNCTIFTFLYTPAETMSQRPTKEELDEQFEQFLKESVSDESVDLSTTKSSGVSLKPSTKTEDSRAWWDVDDDSVGSHGRDVIRGHGYVKEEKAKGEGPRGVSTLDAPPKPIPKPRSKTSDRASQLRRLHTSTQASQVMIGLDPECSHDALRQSIEDENGSSGDGLLASGKTFRKSLRKSQPFQEDEELQKILHREKQGEEESLLFARDSLEPEGSFPEMDSVMASGPGTNITDVGLDTLQEEEEKARFFANLEHGASSTIDYSRLNRDLDSTSSTFGAAFRRVDEVLKEEKEPRVKSRLSPVSPAYSEDFEDDSARKEASEEKQEGHKMLAKVSLHDSLDSMDGAQTPLNDHQNMVEVEKDELLKETPATVQSYGQSGTSEVEALQEAYLQIGLSSDGSVVPEEKDRETPFPVENTLKTTFTTDSDLPTAEELMRCINPGSTFIRGFDFHPACKVDPSPGRKAIHFGEGLEETLEPIPACMELTRTGKCQSIADEVKRLMYEEGDPAPSITSQKAKGKKKQVPQHTSPPRGQQVSRAPVQKKTNITQEKCRKPTMAASTKRIGSTAKQLSSFSKSKSDTHGSKKPPGFQPKGLGAKGGAGLQVPDELLASVQSLTTLLQQQVIPGIQDKFTCDAPVTSSLIADTVELQAAHKPERSETHEADNRLHVCREEITELKRENFLLQTKLHSLEEAHKKKGWSLGDAADPVTDEKLKSIQKEMIEQETLIRGYHQENEKLYQQVKHLQAQMKLSEEAMFAENQRLQVELTATREQMSRAKNQRTVGYISEPDHNQAISSLLAQVQAAQRSEAMLEEEACRLRQEKQAVEIELQVAKQRVQAKAQAIHTSGDKAFEIRILEEKHKEEVSSLNRRLQWFAENQELLDRDAVRLQAATAETQQLKEQLEKLKNEVEKRNGQQQSKAKQIKSEAKRIMELEQQVKELEELLKRRHPNSLPALMLAAAAASAPESTGTGNRPQTVAFMERRIQRLEAELESRDEEAKKSLRTMEQQFHKLKIQYEQRISDLELQLSQKASEEQPDSSQDWKSKVLSLQAELEQVREEERVLREELDSLRAQLQQAQAKEGKLRKSPGRHEQQAKEAQALRIERLSHELASKSRTVQELTRTVERLQKERRSLLSAPSEPKTHTNTAPQTGTFPPVLDEKSYQPAAFAGSHVSDVLQENDGLQARLERQQLEAEQERVELRAAVAKAEGELRRVQEQMAEQVSALRTEHQREIESLLARHAQESSASKVVELFTQLSSQEIMVRHLQEKLKELQGCKEALAVSHIREETLQNQMARLLEELKEAREAHTPELRHFTSLERKIRNMELRHTQRERELQQVITQTRLLVQEEQQKEVEGWKNLAKTKTRELEAFRTELDSILDVLKELQRQGVVIPVPDAQSDLAGFTWT